MATIQGIYVALFGRPADPGGLAYFNAQTGGGADLTAIGDLASQPEYQSRFVGMTNAQIVGTIYQSLFNRAGEAEGIAFYVGELEAGRQTINTIAINILDGAQGTDLAIVNTKIAAANLYTQRLDLPAELAAYNGNAAAAEGRAFLTPVTNTIPTEAQVDAAIAAMVAAGTPGPIVGDTFTLTASAVTPDNITGTPNDDTFRAVVANSLQSTDTLNGGAGNDVLNISAGALVSGASPVVSNIERINNADVNKTLNLSAVTGVEQVWTIPGVGGSATTYTEASLSTRFGYESTLFGGVIVIDYRNADLTGPNDTALLAVNNPAMIATVTVAAADRPLIEAVDIAALGPGGTGSISNIIIDTFTGARSITVTGEGNIAVIANGLTLVSTVDASAASGEVIVVASGSTQNMTVTGSSGNGQFYTGSGNDTIIGGAGADLMFGGAGADTYVIQTTTIEVGGNDTVIGFTTGVDKLQFGGPAGTATNYAEVMAGGTDFLVARSAAITAFAGNLALDYVAVQNAAGVYVFYDGDGDNTLATNGADFAVLLQGINNAQITHTDII